MVALATGKEAFSDYSHLYRPHKFTQPQLFACLVLKEFEKKDYRGIWQLLIDCADLRQVIGLKIVPHYTTLQKASRRLLKVAPVRRLISDTVARINRRRKRVKYAAADSSGFDAHHASRYFIFGTKVDRKGKEPKRRHAYKHYGKLMMKRNIGSALRAKSHHGRMRDILIKVLTHNIALVLLRVFYRADFTQYARNREMKHHAGNFLDPNGTWHAASTDTTASGEYKSNYNFSAQSISTLTYIMSGTLEQSYNNQSTIGESSDYTYNDNLTAATDIYGNVTLSGTGSGTGTDSGLATDTSTYTSAFHPEEFSGDSQAQYNYTGGWNQNIDRKHPFVHAETV